MSTFSFLPLISKPTRIAEDTMLLLDNIFIREPISFVSGNLLMSLSDHLPVFLIHRNFWQCREEAENVKFKYRIINDITLNDQCGELLNFDFSHFLLCNDVSVAVEMIDDIVTRLFKQCCPAKTKSLSHRNITKPWINSLIKTYIKNDNTIIFFAKGGLCHRRLIEDIEILLLVR